jgi:hypothetical protein
MSRGLGKLQRELLETLEENAFEIDTLTLAAVAYRLQRDARGSYGISNAQHTAVRRALCNLHKQGLVVELGRKSYCNRCHWASLKVGLPKQLRWLQFRTTGFDVRSSPAKAAKIKADIAETLERMKQLGIEQTDRPSAAQPQSPADAAV